MIHAAFPGSFDPPTFGHLDIIERAARLFDRLTVLVAENRAKHSLLDITTRISLLTTLLAGKKNVNVEACDTLVVDFMKARNMKALIRGARGLSDFSYESELCQWNKLLAPEIETVLLLPRPEYAPFSSSAVRELRAFGKDLSLAAPPLVCAALEKAE